MDDSDSELVQDFDEVERRRLAILDLTRDVKDSDKQYIIDWISSQMNLPDYVPPNPDPPVSIDVVIAGALSTLPVRGDQAGVVNVHVSVPRPEA